MKILKKKIIWLVIVAGLSMLLIIFSSANGSINSNIISIASASIAVCIVRFLQFFRISRNKDLLKKYEIEQKEERFILLAEKSGRFTLLISIFIEFIAIFVLLFLNKGAVATIVAYVAGLQTAIYLLTYYYLCKKY